MEVTLRLEMSKEYQKDDGKSVNLGNYLHSCLMIVLSSDMKQVVAPIIII